MALTLETCIFPSAQICPRFVFFVPAFGGTLNCGSMSKTPLREKEGLAGEGRWYQKVSCCNPFVVAELGICAPLGNLTPIKPSVDTL